MRLLISLLALSSVGCAFDFSRSDLLGPGEVRGTAVGTDGGVVAHVRATVEGLLTPARADANGGFRVVLGAGVFVVRVVEDKDGDGRAERGALRGVSIRQADIGGERRLTGVELGKVVLLGTGSVRGVVEDESGAAVEAEVVVLRTTTGLGDGGAFAISADDARTLPAEARVRARIEDQKAPFAAEGLVPGPVFVVALASDANGAVLVSAPQLLEVPSEGVVDAGALVVRPPLAATVDVTLDVASTIPALDDELVDVVLASAAGEVDAGRAPINGAQLLSGTAVGRYDLRATSTLRPTELGGALQGQLALSLLDPSNPNAAVAWGPLLLSAGALCGETGDRDGDGRPALPAPSDDLAPWIACAATCADAFGTDAAGATCAVGEQQLDCDDDGDLQPDVTEPFACVSLCAGTDLDGDALCDDVDDDPRCAFIDDVLVCIGDPGYRRPPARPEYLAGEGEGEGEPVPCVVDSDCAPVLNVIALCDQPAGTCASTGVPVPSAPATTYFHGSGGWGQAAAPPPRRNHAMTAVANDPAGFQIYLFGGLTQTGHSNELFAWNADGATWTQIDAGVGPSPRGRAAFAFDDTRRVILLVGGEQLAIANGTNLTTTLDDVWEFDLETATWTQRGTLPGAEPGAALVSDIDDLGLQSLVYLRPTGASVLRADAARAFTPVNMEGVPPTFNGDVLVARATGDPLVFLGAQAGAFNPLTHRTLSSSSEVGGLWNQGLASTALFPAARTGAAIAASFDGVHVFGGDLLADGAPFDGASVNSNELWFFNGDSWLLDIASNDSPGDLPPPRRSAAMAFDGIHIVIVGGDEAIDDDASATLRLIETAGPPTWARAPALPAEPKRREAAFAFDSLRDEVVIVGGRSPTGALLDDAWVFSRQTYLWTQIAGVSARAASAAAYDSARDVIVLFGGEGQGDVLLGDLQELNPATRVWTERTDVLGLPGPRKRHGMAYSPNLLETFIVGGFDGANVIGEVFRYAGVEAFPGSTVPARESPAMTFSLTAGGNGGVALYGGRDRGGVVLGDYCEYFEGTQLWNCSLVDGIAQGPRDEPGLTFDHITGLVMLFGGRDATGTDRNDLWAIGNVSAAATEVTAGFVLPAARTGPVFVSDEQGLFLLGSAP